MQLPFEKIYDSDLIHPEEISTEHECRSDPIYDYIAKETAAFFNRTGERADALMKFYPIDSSTLPRVARLYEKVLKALYCEERYPLYIEREHKIRARIAGSDEGGHVIILSDASVDELDDDELKALLGQAVGAIMANHSQNLQMLELLKMGFRAVPFVETLVEKKFTSEFAEWTEWIIASQFTHDRFALRACGSERAVSSLLLKQNGMTEADLDRALKQRVLRTDKLGIYFVMLANTLTHFGAIERIQELRRWIRSDEFKRSYPGFYYRLMIEGGEFEDSKAMELHVASSSDDANAMVELAHLYINGDEGLSQSFFMVTELSKAAAFLGHGEGLYIYAACLEQMKASDDRIIRRLYEASFSRGFKLAAKKVQGELVISKDDFVERIYNEFKGKYSNRTECKTLFDDQEAERARGAFWMNGDERILALETFVDVKGATYGTAITTRGIFGRFSENQLPYFISWHALQHGDVRLEDKILMCDETKICRIEGALKGTAGELTVRLASALQGSAP